MISLRRKNIIYASLQESQPIPLTKKLFERLDMQLKFPEWIESLHESQNWYYCKNKKTELALD